MAHYHSYNREGRLIPGASCLGGAHESSEFGSMAQEIESERCLPLACTVDTNAVHTHENVSEGTLVALGAECDTRRQQAGRQGTYPTTGTEFRQPQTNFEEDPRQHSHGLGCSLEDPQAEDPAHLVTQAWSSEKACGHEFALFPSIIYASWFTEAED